MVILTGLVGAPAARADALSVVQMLREGGCGGLVPAAPLLRHNPSLDQAAQQWADGHSLSAAAELSGYLLATAQGLDVTGSDDALIQRLRRSECRTVSSRDLREVGSYRRGSHTWLVLAAMRSSSSGKAPPSAAPQPGAALPGTATPAMARRALQLINEARARGVTCGARSFGPAPPLDLSATLAGVAVGHATDMALHDYFEHQDLAGQSPADRVRAAGYHEKLVGENIAYGPQSVDEVVRGWLDSPGHCENIMNPRFAEMGLGLAAGRASRRGLFWVQLLAEPRA